MRSTIGIILTNYITDQLLANPPRQAMWRRLAKYVLILAGIAWGVPWIWASMSAAAIFPAAIASPMAIIFAVGIVCTVGADGWWIMQQASKGLDKLSPAQQKLLSLQYGNSQNRLVKAFLCWLLATLSCIAPVYAAVKFSAGATQLFAIITLIGCYGYGLVGYARLLDQCNQWWHDRHYSRALLTFRTQLVRSMYTLQPAAITTGSEWVKQWLTNSHTLVIDDKTTAAKKSWLQLGCTMVIPVAASLVDIFLISDFLYNNLWSNTVFTIIAAIIAALPAFTINTLATYRVLGKLIPFSQRSRQSKNLVKKPLCLRYIIITLIALLAPSAAAYITYTTLNEHHLPTLLIMLAVIAISAARILFSWFTLNTLIEHMSKHSYWQQRLHIFADALNHMDPTCLNTLKANE